MAFIINFIAVLIGSFITYSLSLTYKQGAVRASALVGVSVGLLLYVFPQLFASGLTKEIPFVIFGGSFIGMVTAEQHIHKWTIVLSSLIFTILFSLKSHDFNGLGGLLGITALLSIVTSVGVLIAIDRLKKRNHKH